MLSPSAVFVTAVPWTCTLFHIHNHKCCDFLWHTSEMIWMKTPQWHPSLLCFFLLQQEQGTLSYFSPEFLYIKMCYIPSPSSCLSKGWQSLPLTKHWEDPTGKPHNQGQTHAARVFQHSFWGDEDATANHTANEKWESPQQSYLFPQKNRLLFLLVFPHDFLLIPGESHVFRSYRLPRILKDHLYDEERVRDSGIIFSRQDFSQKLVKICSICSPQLLDAPTKP